MLRAQARLELAKPRSQRAREPGKGRTCRSAVATEGRTGKQREGAGAEMKTKAYPC